MAEEKHNERGAGRKPKYDEETETVTFRIPKSKKDVVKKMVSDFLSKPNVSLSVKDNITPKLKNIKVTTVKAGLERQKACDCFLDDNGLLRRGKIRCILPKQEHKF